MIALGLEGGAIFRIERGPLEPDGRGRSKASVDENGNHDREGQRTDRRDADPVQDQPRAHHVAHLDEPRPEDDGVGRGRDG